MTPSLFGHLSTLTMERLVVHIAFSPNGTLALVGKDGTIWSWRVADGALLQILQILQERGDAVLCAAFSPDGQLLVAGTYENTAQIWRVADGRLLQILQGYPVWERMYRVAFSPDGQLLAAAGKDGTVRLWNAADISPLGTPPLRTLQGHPYSYWGGGLTSVTFSPDGGLLATAGASRDGIVHLWRVADGALLHILRVHRGSVQSVAFSPDGRLLATAVHSTVRLWSVADGHLLRTLQGHQDMVWDVAFSPNGRILASAGEDGTVRLWRTADGQLLQTLQGRRRTAWQPRGTMWDAVAFSPDGQLLAAAEFVSVYLWRAVQEEEQ